MSSCDIMDLSIIDKTPRDATAKTLLSQANTSIMRLCSRLRFGCVEPFAYKFREFVVHNELSFDYHKNSKAIIAAKRQKTRNFAN